MATIDAILKNDLGVGEKIRTWPETGDTGRVDRNERGGVEVVQTRPGVALTIDTYRMRLIGWLVRFLRGRQIWKRRDLALSFCTGAAKIFIS